MIEEYTLIDSIFVIIFILLSIILFFDFFHSHRKKKFIRSEIKYKKKEFENLSDRQEISNVLDLLDEENTIKSKFTLIILSINGMGILHQGYEKIIKLINNGNKVKILLLSPDDNNNFFQQLIKNELIKGSDAITTKNRLISEWNASMMIIADIKQKTHMFSKFSFTKKIEVRKYSEKVNYGITGLIYSDRKDNVIEPSKILINCKLNTEHVHKEEQYICRFSVKSERLSFHKAKSKFDEIWLNAKEINNPYEELKSLDSQINT